MNVFLTSDQHWGHRNILTYCNRPYQSVEEMNEGLISGHNSVVKPGDTVYHLGDFSLDKRAPEKVLHRLNGEHHLIIGNHDWCHPVHSKTNQTKRDKFRKMYFDAGFKTLELEGAIDIDGIPCLMSHFPYYDPNPQFDQRYPEFRPEDKGNILLHGHVHTSYKIRLSPKGTLMINVGVDQWDMRPVALEQIKALINNQSQ